MKLPQYITAEEVRRVCQELGIRDWSVLSGVSVTPEEARRILDEVNTEGMPSDVEQFKAGLDVELEHGTQYKDANVTNNHPLVTGMIVLAHMKESLDYYRLLDVAEAEGDLARAVAAGNMEKVRKYFRKLAEAKAILSNTQAKQV